MPCFGIRKRLRDFWKEQQDKAEALRKALEKENSKAVEKSEKGKDN